MKVPLFDLDASHESDPKIAQWWQTKPPELASIARVWWDAMRQRLQRRL